MERQKTKTQTKILYNCRRAHSLTDLLDNLQDVCEKAYIAEKRKGIPTLETLRRHLQDFLNYNLDKEQDKEEKKGLFDLIDLRQGKYKIRVRIKVKIL